MRRNSPKPEEIIVDKDKFDALLRKMAATGPLSAKDVITQPRRPKQGKTPQEPS